MLDEFGDLTNAQLPDGTRDNLSTQGGPGLAILPDPPSSDCLPGMRASSSAG